MCNSSPSKTARKKFTKGDVVKYADNHGLGFKGLRGVVTGFSRNSHYNVKVRPIGLKKSEIFDIEDWTKVKGTK
jgi:hypothetical protein